MKKKEQAAFCVAALKEAYPDALCSLDYSDPLQLLIATRLSAQCTDARVNLVTPALFRAYPNLDAFCEAKAEDVEGYIHSCGFFRAKAKDIVGMARMIRDDFGGVVPDTVEALTTLPGVGRKTANLIVGDVYHKPAVVTDTHVIRITNLLGLVDTKDPKKAETELRALLDPQESNDFCHRCVLHGRAVCIARRPQCAQCCLKPVCKSAQG
ncbi:MAG: endonuclease III [Clostridia bacterium]|nr:endonuclease III [Clostridia bacterium]